MRLIPMRYRFRAFCIAFAALVLGPGVLRSASDGATGETVTISEGALRVIVRDNANSPKILSGLDSLFHERDAPAFDAFDPENDDASAGLNFEHIISGHKDSQNAFAPRHGRYALERLPGASARLVRRREDDPWGMSSTFTYTVTAPHYVDFDFRCVPHDRTRFGKRGYAVLFFADYMNDVDDVALHFRGIAGSNQQETWITADAPLGHPDWNQGGTYRSMPAAELEYDADHNFKLNSCSYDYPRFTKPFYYGRAANGMVFMLMFNKMHSDHDEIRFSLFKFKVPKYPRPAWDFQYVIRGIEEEKEYGFKGRLVWKMFVSAEDCQAEYERWAASAREDSGSIRYP